MSFQVENVIKSSKEAFPVLIGCAGLGIIAGILLNDQDLFTPAILIAVPIWMSYTGSLGAMVGSRFTTSYHLGLLTDTKGKFNAIIETCVVLIIGLLFAIFVPLITIFVGNILSLPFPEYAPYRTAYFVGFFTGISCTIYGITASFIVGIVTFKRGLDADNTIIPIVSTVGDVVAVAVMAFLLKIA